MSFHKKYYFEHLFVKLSLSFFPMNINQLMMKLYNNNFNILRINNLSGTLDDDNQLI